MKRPQIYYQRQVGGNCRLHALNGYFGKETISLAQWQKLMGEYDMILAERYNSKTSCKDYDLISAGGQTIISWVLLMRGTYSIYVPPGSGCQVDMIGNADWVFMFDAGHIWGIRFWNGAWYQVDSIRGISSFDINALPKLKYGFIIPADPQIEYVKRVGRINSLIAQTQLTRWIRESIKKGETLGDLELHLSNAVACLDAQLQRAVKKDEFGFIQQIVDRWHTFMAKWTNGNYNDINLIMDHIPWFIVTLPILCSV